MGVWCAISRLHNLSYNKKLVASLILKRHLMPFYSESNELSKMIGSMECPICFLSLPTNFNFTCCCRQPLCTECFLALNRCPFCLQELQVKYRPFMKGFPVASVKLASVKNLLNEFCD